MNELAVRPVCLINGSLRGKDASSYRFLTKVEASLDALHIAALHVAVRGGPAAPYEDEMLARLEQAPAVVVACPLYGYCLPGGLMRLLESWAQYAERHPSPHRPRLYAIVNCGYVVPETMTEAIQVLRHFSARLGLSYRFAVAIATGPVAVMTSPVDIRLRRALRAIPLDIQAQHSDPKPDLFIKPMVPRLFLDSVREFLDWRVQRGLRKSEASKGPK